MDDSVIRTPVQAAGRFRRSYARARRAGDHQIVVSFWLGVGGFASLLLGVIADAQALVVISLIAAIPAIVTARFARQRARDSGDSDLVYLSRYGQITGWIVVGLFLIVLLFIAVVFGSLAGALAD